MGDKPVITFDEFFSEHRGSLFAQAYALTGDLDEAQDLVQEVMLRTWQRWDRVSQMDRPSSWARRVLLNLAVGRWRKRRVHRSVNEADTPIPAPGVGHLDVAKALRQLPDQQRNSLLLHDVVGMSVAEVAVEMGVPEGSVRGWLSRGRRTLAENLGLSRTNSPERKIK
jgi:RNA polymerase sigma-70 factor (ECF subfamily)